MSAPSGRRVAIVGAGWAGLAAAVDAIETGWQVTLLEAARAPGGRARSVLLPAANGVQTVLDNGQHILIGAYAQSLALMQRVGIDPAKVLRRTPLDLRDAQGRGLALPRLPSPWNGVAGILTARGWTWPDRLALLRRLAAWRRAGFTCGAQVTVAQLCEDLPPAVVHGLIEPLCTAALNTPLRSASAAVFLRVLQDSLQGGAGSSDLLLPRVPLGQLLAQPALAWLQAHGARVRLGARAMQLRRTGLSSSTAAAEGAAPWRIDGEAFDAVILATPVWEAQRLLEDLAQATPETAATPNWQAWLQAAQGMAHEAITTVYVQVPPPPRDQLARPLLPRPMLQLDGVASPAATLGAAAVAGAQFVFDRQQLSQDAGLLAFVASASVIERAILEQTVLQQARRVLQAHGHGAMPRIITSIVEKRATFACTAGLVRPGQRPSALWPGLLVCGDYVEGPYPATLEGAVISGRQAAAALTAVNRP
ncbi:hydroxysqualene dehydroxylase HpnE [Corticibacter populi]|uniref:hydroxysqualene dehydroxylase HpnE n=1 Tax=Corticibacter populi TaxID=1550736 RepID=UPI001F5EE2ED|nr:hydroxysqualene dehydroxylase HpnE [Corticibacter populi]